MNQPPVGLVRAGLGADRPLSRVAGLRVSDLVGLLVRARQRGFGVADLVEPVQRASIGGHDGGWHSGPGGPGRGA